MSSFTIPFKRSGTYGETRSQVETYVNRVMPSAAFPANNAISTETLLFIKDRAERLDRLATYTEHVHNHFLESPDCSRRSEAAIAQRTLRAIAEDVDFSPTLKSLKIDKINSSRDREKAAAKIESIKEIANIYRSRFNSLLSASNAAGVENSRHQSPNRHSEEPSQHRLGQRTSAEALDCSTNKPLFEGSDQLALNSRAADFASFPPLPSGFASTIGTSIAELAGHQFDKNLLSVYKERCNAKGTSLIGRHREKSADVNHQLDRSITDLRRELLNRIHERMNVHNAILLTNSIARDVLNELYKRPDFREILESIGIRSIRSQHHVRRATTKLVAIGEFLDSRQLNMDDGQSKSVDKDCGKFIEGGNPQHPSAAVGPDANETRAVNSALTNNKLQLQSRSNQHDPRDVKHNSFSDGEVLPEKERTKTNQNQVKSDSAEKGNASNINYFQLTPFDAKNLQNDSAFSFGQKTGTTTGATPHHAPANQILDGKLQAPMPNIGAFAPSEYKDVMALFDEKDDKSPLSTGRPDQNAGFNPNPNASVESSHIPAHYLVPSDENESLAPGMDRGHKHLNTSLIETDEFQRYLIGTLNKPAAAQSTTSLKIPALDRPSQSQRGRLQGGKGRQLRAAINSTHKGPKGDHFHTDSLRGPLDDEYNIHSGKTSRAAPPKFKPAGAPPRIGTNIQDAVLKTDYLLDDMFMDSVTYKTKPTTRHLKEIEDILDL